MLSRQIVVNGEGNEECQNEGETFIWQLVGLVGEVPATLSLILLVK